MQALRKVAPGAGLSLEEVAEPLRRGDGRRRRGRGGERLRHRSPHPPLGRLGGRPHSARRSRSGHEFAGTVVEVGADVRHVAVGDFVSAESHITCGACVACRTGNGHMCERTQILGVDRDGAFARYVAVPESVIWKTDRAKLPPEIATLQEPFGNAVFATSEQDLSGRSVAVLGCGPVGLFTVAIARASGAARRPRVRPPPVSARARAARWARTTS